MDGSREHDSGCDDPEFISPGGHEDVNVDAGMSNESHSMRPVIVAKPPAGTAMIWGATLQQALPVTKGTRAVYVGSFDLKSGDAALVL